MDFKIFRNKRGVSPIIAAVLLVVITIAIGATTMAFIRGLTDQNLQAATEKSDEIQCGAKVKFEILKVGNNQKICKETEDVGYLWAIIKNNGDLDIKSFRLTVTGGGDVGYYLNKSNISIKKKGIGTINLSYEIDDVEAEEFILEPILDAGQDKEIFCSNLAETWTKDEIRDCNSD